MIYACGTVPMFKWVLDQVLASVVWNDDILKRFLHRCNVDVLQHLWSEGLATSTNFPWDTVLRVAPSWPFALWIIEVVVGPEKALPLSSDIMWHLVSVMNSAEEVRDMLRRNGQDCLPQYPREVPYQLHALFRHGCVEVLAELEKDLVLVCASHHRYVLDVWEGALASGKEEVVHWTARVFRLEGVPIQDSFMVFYMATGCRRLVKDLVPGICRGMSSWRIGQLLSWAIQHDELLFVKEFLDEVGKDDSSLELEVRNTVGEHSSERLGPDGMQCVRVVKELWPGEVQLDRGFAFLYKVYHHAGL
jgi:hypothetical protein